MTKMPDKNERYKAEVQLPTLPLRGPFTHGRQDFLPDQELAPGAASRERLSDESLKAIMENYVLYYASGAGHTARAKRYDLQYFLEFLAQPGKLVEQVLVSDWTLHQTQSFIDHRLALGESPATVSRRLATIKHFGRTLAERVHGFINPAREARAPTHPVLRPRGLTPTEIRALRDAADTLFHDKPETYRAIRDRFLFELLLSTGLRADEVRLLVMGQISEDFHWFRNVKTKGKKFRSVYLDSQIRGQLEEYVAKRSDELLHRFPTYAELSATDSSKFPLFVGFYRASVLKPSTLTLSPKTVWRIIATIGKRARSTAQAATSNLHPHLLRHTFAHGLLDSSRDVRLVAQALGHSDVRTTMRYTERSEEEIARAIEKKVSRNG